MRPRFLLFGAALAVISPALPAAALADCAAPEDLVDDAPRLPQLAEHFRDLRPVTIVAIGGASTAGNAAGNPDEDAYPHRLETVLRQRYPGVPITVVNKGVARQTTQEMVDRFERDVFALAPTVVIWETGTFDATRNVDIEAFASALETGLAQLRERRLDTMLMNMQYSRNTASVINFEPYLEAMEQRADVDDVYLFRRFEMMKYWSENGIFKLADVPKEQRAELAAQVYRCIAERLADAIEYALR
jgi:acyl-CoA thioesterase-1